MAVPLSDPGVESRLMTRAPRAGLMLELTMETASRLPRRAEARHHVRQASSGVNQREAKHGSAYLCRLFCGLGAKCRDLNALNRCTQ